ncbi:MAG: aldehyde dehydrogenase [Anaerolineales bacterium]|nr:aldehyde dehydrogenase [Anaerolineales bacterium]
MLLNGQWRPSASGATRPVINPVLGLAFTDVPEATEADAQAALEAANAAAHDWGRLPPIARAKLLQALAQKILDNLDALAPVIVREQGKPLAEAQGEVRGTANFFNYAAGQARSIEGEILPSDNPQEEVWIRRVPFGVTVALLPWNYPAAMVGRKLAPALLAGNTVVLKPHEDTPLSALFVARLATEVGIPPGVINVITGQGETVGAYLVRSPLTKLVTVTGSTAAGRAVMRDAAEHITVVSLELGGKAPFIVMDDANVDEAVKLAVSSRFRNNGQVCICNERTYVQRRRYAEFVEKLLPAVARLKVGDPMQPGTDLGPKVSLAELEKVERMVRQAVEQGAEVLTGGQRPHVAGLEGGYWYAPTVLAGMRNDMDLMQCEVFGPVLPVMPFDDFDEALALANDSRYGLSAYLFTEDFRRVMRAVNDIEFGELYINRIGPEAAYAYHTGFRESGIGGEGGKYGLEAYLQKKTVYLNYAGPR